MDDTVKVGGDQVPAAAVPVRGRLAGRLYSEDQERGGYRLKPTDPPPLQLT